MAIVVKEGLELSDETKARFDRDGFFGHWEFEHACKGGETLTALMHGRAVGVLFVLHDTKLSRAYVASLYIVTEARRLGVGTALMRRVEESCVEKGETMLHVVPVSSALGFYRRVGMFPSDRRDMRDFVRHTDLSYEDLESARGGSPPCVGKLTKVIRKKRKKTRTGRKK
jgi:ribosomal protein S18 acetylase RimI-like enzyme